MCAVGVEGVVPFKDPSTLLQRFALRPFKTRSAASARGAAREGRRRARTRRPATRAPRRRAQRTAAAATPAPAATSAASSAAAARGTSARGGSPRRRRRRARRRRPTKRGGVRGDEGLAGARARATAGTHLAGPLRARARRVGLELDLLAVLLEEDAQGLVVSVEAQRLQRRQDVAAVDRLPLVACASGRRGAPVSAVEDAGGTRRRTCRWPRT